VATDVSIPGDDIEQASKSLGVIQDHIDIGTGNFNFDLAFGSNGRMRDAAGNFERAWKDGRIQLKDQIDQIKQAMDKVVAQFGQMDTDAGNQLDAGNGGGS
jgi:hypothetical protein